MNKLFKNKREMRLITKNTNSKICVTKEGVV